MRIVRLTAIFAGIAAVFTAGGLGRLAAYASVDGGRWRAAWVAGRAHAVAGIGLVVIAAIPHGHIPERSWLWLWYPVIGIGVGAFCGVVIGVVCGGVAPVGIGDVFALAKQPTRVIGKVVSAEDITKLGHVLRARTSHMFEGMFEPAPKPPGPTDDAKPDAKPPEDKPKS